MSPDLVSRVDDSVLMRQTYGEIMPIGGHRTQRAVSPMNITNESSYLTRLGTTGTEKDKNYMGAMREEA